MIRSRPIPRPLSRSLLHLVLVATLLPLVALVALGIYQFRQDLAAVEDFVQQESQASAQQAASTLALLAESTRRTLDRVEVAQSEGRVRPAYFRRVLDEQPFISSLVVTDAAGRVIANSLGEGGGSLAGLTVFRAIAAGEPFIVSDVFESPLLDEPEVAMAIPRQVEGRFAGMVLARLKASAIAELLRARTGDAKEAVTYVTDRKGRVLAHPDSALAVDMLDLAEHPPVVAALRGETGWSHYQSPLFGDTARVAGYTSVPGIGWAVISSREAADQLVGVQSRLRNYLLVTILACTFAGAGAMWWGRRLARPLEALSGSMRQVAEVGLRQQPYPVLQEADVTREVAEYETLATAFNALIRELNRRFEEAVTYQEELQAQNEELQAQTEELQAQSEELQAQTEEIQTQNLALARLTAEANAANKLKSEFLANMSHELRTPLNSVIGYTELVTMSKKTQLDERGRRNLEVVLRNARHLLALINDVLDLSKVEAGKMTVYAEPTDLESLVTAVANTTAPMARERGLDMHVDVAAGLEGVITDETKVRQIILNLVSNAVKFTREGAISIRAYELDAERIAIAVADSGIGIAPEHQAVVFEAFRQVDSSTTREAGGTGLGLAIALKLAQALGGELTLESQRHQGSTFTLILPRVWAHYQPSERQRVPAAAPAAVTVPEGMSAVVAIDDDPETLQLITETLRDSPYMIVPASSGESGLHLVREVRPHAVTLDLLMPRIDGWAVLRALKADPATADVPVIIVSFVENRLLGFTMGAADYLVKPVQREQLLQALDRHSRQLRGPGGHCLVVEDDPDARELYGQLLQAEGVPLVEARDGHEAIAAMEAELPAVVILDLMIPHLDGFELLAWLRGNPRTRDLPVIVVTAKSLTPEERARLAAARAVYRKGTLAPSHLIRDLREVLDSARDRQEVP